MCNLELHLDDKNKKKDGHTEGSRNLLLLQQFTHTHTAKEISDTQ